MKSAIHQEVMINDSVRLTCRRCDGGPSKAPSRPIPSLGSCAADLSEHRRHDHMIEGARSGDRDSCQLVGSSALGLIAGTGGSRRDDR